MAFAIGDILQLQVRTFLRDQAGLNIHHFEVVAQNGPLSEQVVTDLVSVAMSNLYFPVISNDAVFVGVGLQRVSSIPKGAVWESTQGQAPGTGGAQALPRQTCGLISWKTALAGADNRGRTYVPFPTEDFNQAGGVCTAAYRTLLTTLRDGITGDHVYSILVGVTDITLRHKLFKPGNPTAKTITGGIVRPSWATQRRRSSFGKINPNPL